MSEDKTRAAASAEETPPNIPEASVEQGSGEASPETTPPAEPTPEGVAKEALEKALAETKAKAEAQWDELLRARAEAENLRRRHAREMEAARKFAIENFISELLPVRDSLELGAEAAREASADVVKLREGTELTLKLMGDVMARFGVEQVHPEGQLFNPDYHQAMSVQEREDVPPNTVVLVVQKGYTLNGRLIRPAMVMVSRAPSDG